jgi:hypothetical protein
LYSFPVSPMHLHHSSHILWFDHPTNVWQSAGSVELLVK